MGFISLVEEIQFMLIGSRPCFRLAWFINHFSATCISSGGEGKILFSRTNVIQSSVYNDQFPCEDSSSATGEKQNESMEMILDMELLHLAKRHQSRSRLNRSFSKFSRKLVSWAMNWRLLSINSLLLMSSISRSRQHLRPRTCSPAKTQPFAGNFVSFSCSFLFTWYVWATNSVHLKTAHI